MSNNEVINQAFGFMILNEATNIAENKSLSDKKIKNRAAIKTGVAAMEKVTGQLYKYDDFTDAEIGEMKQLKKSLGSVWDILDRYVGKENLRYEQIKKAIGAVSYNIDTQLVHKEEQEATAHLVGQTAAELDAIFDLHRDLFPVAFNVITQLDKEKQLRFQSQFDNLLTQFKITA